VKLAVTATEGSLDADVDPRFGRCPWFVLVETDDMAFQAFENSSASLGAGAGVQSARLMADEGVARVLTGDCGPKAARALAAAGIGVVTGCSGTVRQAVEDFEAGRLSPDDGGDAPADPAEPADETEGELDLLSQQAKALSEELARLEERIRRLGRKP